MEDRASAEVFIARLRVVVSVYCLVLTAEFATAGLETIPAPTGLLPPLQPSVLLDYFPSVDGLQWSYYALYELYANAARHLRY